VPPSRPPFLHELVSLVAAPTQVWSDRSGDIHGARTAQGVLHADVRVLSRLTLTVDGTAPELLSADLVADHAVFTSLVRPPSADSPEVVAPLRVDRRRSVRPGQVTERVVLTSAVDVDQSVTVELRLGCDFAGMDELRIGAERPAVPISDRWSDGTITAELDAPGATLTSAGDELVLRWPVSVPARGQGALGWTLAVRDAGGLVAPAASTADPAELVQRALALAGPAADQDRRLRPWVETAIGDLCRLRMSTVAQPSETFYAAGAPWYFTLFGRDSLLSARMLLAVDPSVAAGTLATLARLQGTKVDPEAAEQPGKIMHELRRTTSSFGGMRLPPLYFGTIDATPVWIVLLGEAWRAGLAEDAVRALLPALEGALAWLTTYADADGDGFLEYLDPSGHGLANQGWKDSADAVRFADGFIAKGPVALCEVQGYAYEAAVRGAELLDVFGLDGGEGYRQWADDLKNRFRERFWCERDGRRFPALALDGEKLLVDSLTSNIGHLLGTGLLDHEEERIVAKLVSGPELDSGLGLRTMASTEGGYDPLSYHCGSVWPHDTAMVIAGLVRAGLGSYARGLVEGLLEASVAFDGRLPELWSGEGRPVPYPMACRPQAWSAAAVVPVLVALAET
jgi:N-terminal domain of (some) glycogen debranching enzymes/Amylo-alpha-1,6-glucosidase